MGVEYLLGIVPAIFTTWFNYSKEEKAEYKKEKILVKSFFYIGKPAGGGTFPILQEKLEIST